VRQLIPRLLFWLALPVIAIQGTWLKFRAPRFPPAAGPVSGSTGQGAVLRLHAIGDSIVAGVGAATTMEALPALLATALANKFGRQVRWNASGQSGARSERILTELVPQLPEAPADVVFISTGVNDVTGLKSTRHWRRQLNALWDALHKYSPDAVLLIAGLPPMHIFPLLPQPLRAVIGMRARTFDAIVAELAGQREYCLFVPTRFDPGAGKFSDDGYHPSEASYRVWAEKLADLLESRLNSR